MKHYLFRMLLAVLLTATTAANALTLGGAQVKSYLGQPLSAEIDLIGLAPGQHENLRLRIANDRHFDRLGIAYTRFLSTLEFDVVQSSGRWMVRVRSDAPVTEPFLDFPLQMTWPGGQLVRQYTLLLDPPRRIQPARTSAGRRTTPSTATKAASPAADGSSYGPVRRGETLWPIAQKLKPSGITTRQMAMALLRANPHAFIDGNINRLRTGVNLQIPQRSFIEQLDAATARAEFNAQTRQWQAPVATSPRTVEAPVVRPPAAQTDAAQSPDATEQEPTEEPAETRSDAQDANQAQLRILTEKREAEGQTGSQQDLQEQLLVTMEEIESNRITTDAIEARLARMESELQRMQKLVELKDAQIAALQAEASARAAIQAAAREAEPPPPPPVSAPPAQTEIAATPAEPAPISITRIEPLPTDTTATAKPWHEEYLWVIWAVLGLMGLVALLILMRRPQPAAEESELGRLPDVTDTPDTMLEPATPAPIPQIREAEEGLGKQTEEQLTGSDAAEQPAETQAETSVRPGLAPQPEEDLPELEIPPSTRADADIEDGISESLLNEVLDDKELLADDDLPDRKEADFSDDDIASWVAELGKDTDNVETQSANDERIPLDDEIPDILTELDDQLSGDKEAALPPVVELEPASEPVEDDTFSMSLDLARAYLEIGDQEGARDMLKQALSGARDPDHRRQIEELLAQID